MGEQELEMAMPVRYTAAVYTTMHSIHSNAGRNAAQILLFHLYN